MSGLIADAKTLIECQSGDTGKISINSPFHHDVWVPCLVMIQLPGLYCSYLC